MWMVSYVVDIAFSFTHLGKVIRGHFDLVIGILNFAFKYGPDRIEQKQLRNTKKNHFALRFYPKSLTLCGTFLYVVL